MNTDIQVSGLTFLLLLVGSAVYLGLHWWAIVEAARLDRWGWVVGIFVLGPVGLIAWILRGRRQD